MKMIKSFLLITLSICTIALTSCKKNTENQDLDNGADPNKINLQPELENNTNSNLKAWVNYYTQDGNSFSLAKFELKNTDTIHFLPGTIIPAYESDFDTVYKPYLFYSPDRSKYIDIDSYWWRIGDNDKIGFEPDQEIDLVNLKTKEVSRIKFFGPSEWVETVVWETNDIVYLLENTIYNVPVISKIDLQQQLEYQYFYTDTLKFQSDFTRIRLSEKGAQFN